MYLLGLAFRKPHSHPVHLLILSKAQKQAEVLPMNLKFSGYIPQLGMCSHGKGSEPKEKRYNIAQIHACEIKGQRATDNNELERDIQVSG